MPLSGRFNRRAFLFPLVVALAVAACGDETSAPALERYVVALTGAAERPNPVTTTAAASAVLTVISPDSIEYVLYATGDSITASHIHAGDASVSGPIMVFTFGGPVTGRFDGVLRHGHITRQGTFSGVFTYDSLLTRMRAGTSYLNVHTRRFPGGEVRGQIVR